MKKKGFTLVELLAVIAILAILVIIALPNVMGMFNTAKKNSFSTEVKQIMEVAAQQWITDGAMAGTTTTICYQRKSSTTGNNADAPVATKQLDLSGRTNLAYAICLDKAGKVTSFAATDGTYVFSYQGTGLQAEKVTAADGAYTANDGKVYTISDTSGKTGAKITYTSSKVSATLY